MIGAARAGSPPPQLSGADALDYGLADGVAKRSHRSRDRRVYRIVYGTGIATGVGWLRVVLDRQLGAFGGLRTLIGAAGHVGDDGLDHEQRLVDGRGNAAAGEAIAIAD